MEHRKKRAVLLLNELVPLTYKIHV